MFMSLLIMNVQVFSTDMSERYLAAREAILHYNGTLQIKIPQGSATHHNGGPLIGERYYVRYLDGLAQDNAPQEFCFIGTIDGQLVFATFPQEGKPADSSKQLDNAIA